MFAIALLLAPVASAQAAQRVIASPTANAEFGTQVLVLANGDFVVAAPGDDSNGVNAGAIYHYRADGALRGTLRGSSSEDRVGSAGLVRLPSGNYLVLSPLWNNGGAVDAGAVSFAPMDGGLDGTVSAANSLVGSSGGDTVGAPTLLDGSGPAVTILVNGNYVVATPSWDDGAIADVGAVTLGSGSSGIIGTISAANSLVGSTASDRVGLATEGGVGVDSFYRSVYPLSDGDFVVLSRRWRNLADGVYGAATWVSGTDGRTGPVSTANSIVGSHDGDAIFSSVTALTNGNYVVSWPLWDLGGINAAGAATWAPGDGGFLFGPVAPDNSLVGSTVGASVGRVVVALSNGNYVVGSPFMAGGAATFGNGGTGVVGSVSASNSLLGATNGDMIDMRIVPLVNGNYVVASPRWDNGAAIDAGAATFGSGASGVTGTVSATNALVGTQANDRVGTAVTALGTGNYVVGSPRWHNGTLVDAGAATFADGASGIQGIITTSNSLVGSAAGEAVGVNITALGAGDYVVNSPQALGLRGAVTWGSGATGIAGAVSDANSLTGSSVDSVGGGGSLALADGRFLVFSPAWNEGAAANVGAVTLLSGADGNGQSVSGANSMLGRAAGDVFGQADTVRIAREFSNGNVAFYSSLVDNGAIDRAGAVSLVLVDHWQPGPISADNSVFGLVSDPTLGSQVFDYDPTRNQLVVGQPLSNRVVLLNSGAATTTAIIGDGPDPSAAGAPVTFTAVVNSSAAPTDGFVTFRASDGQSCVADTPVPDSATTATFACAITFTDPGTMTVAAEYTGSYDFAYSRSGPEPHTTAGFVIATGVEPAGSGGVACDPNPVDAGANSLCTATANAGYHFTAWSGDCAGSVSSCVLSNVTSSKSVVAIFVLDALPNFLSVSIDNGREYSSPGDAVIYVVTVRNDDTEIDANGLSLSTLVEPPGALLDPVWACAPVSVPFCAPPVGAGAPALTLNVPAQSQAVIEFSAEVAAFDPTLAVSVNLVVPDQYDDDPIDNGASDIDGPVSLFKDGFEGSTP